jgi:predicted NAD/FAD-dependent oxidoreductase
VKKAASVAVIGAGLSGLSCAQALRAAGVDVRVFESASFVGGRCATRLWQGHLVDHGVQYFTAQSPEFKKELLTRLRQFRPIISPILDSENRLIASSNGPRFYVLQGNNYLAHVFSHGLDMRLNTGIESLSFRPAGIECLGENYQAVVSSLPGPQTARLFGLAQTPAEYEPCLLALLEYSGVGIGNSRECYARMTSSNNSILLSSHCENHKAGRIIGDKSVFVVQATPAFSREHFDEPPEKYAPLLAMENEELWHIPPNQRTAVYGHRWHYARSSPTLRHRVHPPRGAFFCGDSRTESAIEDVWLDGRRAAGEVLVYLAELSA